MGIISKIKAILSPAEITWRTIRDCVNKANPVILEIGCNDGSHTKGFIETFESPTIHCFEPDPRAADRFRRRIGDDPHVTLHQLAISSKDGACPFYQSSGQPEKGIWDEGWDLSGSILKPKDHLSVHPWVKFEDKIIVKTNRLDTWCMKNGIEAIDFIWMDVQGAEANVFNGGYESLRRTRYVYTEYNNREMYSGQLPLDQLMNLRAMKGFKVSEAISKRCSFNQ